MGDGDGYIELIFIMVDRLIDHEMANERREYGARSGREW